MLRDIRCVGNELQLELLAQWRCEADIFAFELDSRCICGDLVAPVASLHGAFCCFASLFEFAPFGGWLGRMLVMVGWVVFCLAGFFEREDETGYVSEELRYAILEGSC
jgi:hypothetical protein